MMYDDLRGKTVLITGGSGGLGRQLIADYSSAGANLIVHARNFTKDFDAWLKALASESNVEIAKMKFDLSDEQSINDAFRTLPTSMNIDVLINNAGEAHGGLTQMTSVSEIRRIFEVNYFSQVQVTQLVLRRMMRRRTGNIVNLSSISGLDSKAGNVAYGASKSAINAFTKTLSAELGEFGIRVNCVAPGITDTNMAALMESKALKAMIEDSGMKRAAKPSEISGIVLFLSSVQSIFINGQILRVDGGPA